MIDGLEDPAAKERFMREWREAIGAERARHAWREANTCAHCGHCPREPHYSYFRSRASGFVDDKGGSVG